MRSDGKTLLIGSRDPEVLEAIARAAQSEGYRVESAATRAELLDRLVRKPHCSAVVLDQSAPALGGLENIREVRRADPRVRIVVVVGASGGPAREAAPCDSEAARNAADACGPAASDFFFGPSRQMRELALLAGDVARSDAPVLILGESGVGKESLARHIHGLSRAGKPFLAVRCKSLEPAAMQGSFCGCDRPLPSGAVEHTPGLLERADGGTVLLDDVNSLDPSLQAELVSVLHNRPLSSGGLGPRFISCSSADLEPLAAGGLLNPRLYYHLNVITISIPPLRERTEDILPLADFLLQRHARPGTPPPHLTAGMARQFLACRWPGNGTEMENRIRRILLLGGAAEALDCPAPEPPGAAPPALHGPDFEQVTNAAEKAEIKAIFAALNAAWWNRRKAAALLHISYKALLYRMRKYSIDDKLVFMSRPAAKAPHFNHRA